MRIVDVDGGDLPELTHIWFPALNFAKNLFQVGKDWIQIKPLKNNNLRFTAFPPTVTQTEKVVWGALLPCRDCPVRLPPAKGNART